MSAAVIDTFSVAGDPEMPTLARALDPGEVQRHFGRGLRRLAGEDGFVHLTGIRVARYKPTQRCLIEYSVEVERSNKPLQPLTLIGKVRAKHKAAVGHRLLRGLWNAGFRVDSPDGISVPQPIGKVKDLQMWLQRKVPGRTATELLVEQGGVALAEKIVEAACKLHRAGVPTDRRHTMADELRILRKRLPTVANGNGRIERILDACEQLAARTPEPIPCGIHRDFYPDQVIVDGSRLCLVDFDLYCHGDPALDIGNFLGNVTEQSLRTLGEPNALIEVERAMEERFVELSGEGTRPAVRAYATLTLVRHIYLSTVKPERRPFTERLFELCEERLEV